MNKKLLYLLLFVFSFLTTETTLAQDLSLFEKQTFINKGDTLQYRILLPENFDASKKYPLLLFLHGAGERGNDNEQQLTHGAKLFLKDSVRKQFPAIIIFPQCPENNYWSNVKISSVGDNRTFNFQVDGDPTLPLALTQKMLKDYIKKGNVNTKKVYIMGLSMGGMGTFEMLWRNPKQFAAAIPICGGARPETVSKYAKKTAVWIFHGAKDAVVPVDFSRTMYKALQDAGCDVKYTEYPEVNHNSWDNAFAEPTLLTWLFSQSK